MMNRITILFIFCMISGQSIEAQISRINFTLNNFIHQKSTFTPTNEVDTKGAFSEPTLTFGQHYFLLKENALNEKIGIQYGIGIGYTRLGFRLKTSTDFLSNIIESQNAEKRDFSANTMITAPVGIVYNLLQTENSALYLNFNFKTIFALRTGIGSRSSSNGVRTHRIRVVVNDENSFDFTVGTALDYRRRIAKSEFWWKVELNFNYALTEYYNGTGTLFGDDGNLEYEISNKLNHVGLAVGILKSM